MPLTEAWDILKTVQDTYVVHPYAGDFFVGAFVVRFGVNFCFSQCFKPFSTTQSFSPTFVQPPHHASRVEGSIQGIGFEGSSICNVWCSCLIHQWWCGGVKPVRVCPPLFHSHCCALPLSPSPARTWIVYSFSRSATQRPSCPRCAHGWRYYVVCCWCVGVVCWCVL